MKPYTLNYDLEIRVPKNIPLKRSKLVVKYDNIIKEFSLQYIFKNSYVILKPCKEIPILITDENENVYEFTDWDLVEDELVLEYVFYEGNGNVLHDLSENGIDAEISNAEWTLLKTGKYALYFDGHKSYVAIPNHKKLNLDDKYDNITIEIAFNATNPKKSKHQVIYEEGGDVNGLNFYIDPNGNLCVGMWAESLGFNGIWIQSPIEANKWYHVVFILKDGKHIYVYINGNLVGHYDEATSLPHHPGYISIGATRAGTKYHDIGDNPCKLCDFFEGYVALLRRWNRVLEVNEINFLYKYFKWYIGLE